MADRALLSPLSAAGLTAPLIVALENICAVFPYRAERIEFAVEEGALRDDALEMTAVGTELEYSPPRTPPTSSPTAIWPRHRLPASSHTRRRTATVR